MAVNSNLDLLKAAYAEWESTKGDPAPWERITQSDFKLTSVAQGKSALEFAAPRNSRSEFLEYIKMLTMDWSMEFWKPEQFICEGDRIAMVGTCGWKHKKTGKRAAVLVSHFWTFRSNKAASVIEVFDSAAIMDAATP